MQVAAAYLLSNSLAPAIRCCMPPQERRLNINARRYAVSAGETVTSTSTVKHEASPESSLGKLEKNMEEVEQKVEEVGGDYEKKKSLKDYFEESKALIGEGGGPPRWVSPSESGRRLEDSPLLLYLPGLYGVGLGLIRHHHSLSKMFEIWCLHIPVMDRTSFTDLVELVETKVRTENRRSPNRPIYLVGETIGACIALSVAARNPDVDLVLIVSNSGKRSLGSTIVGRSTCFEKSTLKAVVPMLEFLSGQLPISPSFFVSLMTGIPLRLTIEHIANHLPPQQFKFQEVAQDLAAVSSYLSIFEEILPRETLQWKLELLQSGSAFASARIHDVKAQTLILAGGKDRLLPSKKEGKRLYHALEKGELREFNNGHFLFLEDGFDLVSVIKGSCFYRRGKYHDPSSDYIPPTPREFKNLSRTRRLLSQVTSPVILSTLEDGKIVKGLAGIPSEGPVIYVGYHMLLGFDYPQITDRIWVERNVMLRGLGHPLLFTRLKKGGCLPPLSNFDEHRLMGVVLVNATNMYKLLSSNSHVLLYPGGMRETVHRKGEQYKLIWPEQSEFVRMAARFGAKIVPFGTVGEDDFGEVFFDYDDQIHIPFLIDFYKKITSETVILRTDDEGEVGNQLMHIQGIMPKFPPGRFYYYFGKPIETKGRSVELRDKDKAQELYLEVKSEVEKCIAFLKEKREADPYRNIFSRLAYQVKHGFDVEVPSFDV